MMRRLPDDPDLFNTEEENKKHAEAILKRLSVISALAITSLWLILPFVTSPKTYGGIVYYIMIFIIAAQWILVIPATIVIFCIYTQFWHQNKKYKLSVGKRIRIPLVYNLLAANSLVIFNLALLPLSWFFH